MEILRISIFLAFTGLPAYAVPIANSTSKVEPEFVSEPRQRGTIGLLWSCVVTFALCIWTAVHPNILPNQKDRFRNMYKIVYMLVAAFFPEIVVAIAFNELRLARKIRRELSKSEYSEVVWALEDIKLKKCFFVVMGGIIGEVGHGPGQRTCVITPEQFIECAKTRAIQNDIFRKETMADKGNSSNIAKLLVCTQIFWLIVGSVMRKASGLPVTLLEFHVVIQVVCAIVMYGFW
ncbi:hypothetical protein K440DRAFT_542332, partial [Wilcoxina mikolae CBS 423.85]